MPKSKGKKSSKSPKKSELDETKPHDIKEKLYVTREIETSITLLESPESNIVLESLLFLSKYADIQKNNLNFLQAHGLLPKLLGLLDHNICILRVTLRLLSQLLTVEAAQVELNDDRFDEKIVKISSFYTSHEDIKVKEFSVLILKTYCKIGKVELLLNDPNLIKTILKTIKSPENDVILNGTFELFNKFLEVQEVRLALSKEENFNLDVFVSQMAVSDDCFKTILSFFEKMTYFGEDELQIRLRECHLIEHLFKIITDPERKEHITSCLNIITHCMRNENTNTYFIQSLEFLKFCQWVKTCPDDVMLQCANIFLELAKIDSIRQMLCDLSVEDTILSFLRSSDKKVLNATYEAITFMSKHKYCCEKIITPVVIKLMLQILSEIGESDDIYNETVLKTLHYFARRDARTLHMICENNGIPILFNYLKLGPEKLSESCYKKLLDVMNMLVTNNQLQSYVLSPDLYDVILTQVQSKFDEICMRSVELMINCLNYEDFQKYFILNKGSQLVMDKMSKCGEKVIRMLVIFLHNALMYEQLSCDLIHNKLLLLLKKIPEGIQYRNPLIGRTIQLIYNLCLPLKFFETGRLDLLDKLDETFYIITGLWSEPFPFLEVLQLRQVSTLSTIYVVDIKTVPEPLCDQCYDIQEQNIQSILGSKSSMVTRMSSVRGSTRGSINYGRLSPDPYLPKYVNEIRSKLLNVKSMKEKVKILAEFIDTKLCGPNENCTVADKLHSFKLHIECIKEKLGTNMLPIGYLRLGFHCERALLFKALADQLYIPATLVKGKNKLYWNEIALVESEGGRTLLKMFVVDLMNKIGQLLPLGSRQCNAYCDFQ